MLSDEDYHAALALNALLDGYLVVPINDIVVFHGILHVSESKHLMRVLVWEKYTTDELIVLMSAISHNKRFIDIAEPLVHLDNYFVSRLTDKTVDWNSLCLIACGGGWMNLLAMAMDHFDFLIRGRLQEMIYTTIKFGRDTILQHLLVSQNAVEKLEGSDVLEYAAKHHREDMMIAIVEHSTSIATAAKAINAAAPHGLLKVMNALLPKVTDEFRYLLRDTLSIAASAGQYAATERLLEINRDNQSFIVKEALFVAASSGHLGVLNLLLACPEMSNNVSSEPHLRAAAMGGHYNIICRLLEYPDVAETTHYADIFSQAIARGFNKIVARLLDEPRGLEYARANSNKLLCFAAAMGRLDIVQLLFEQCPDMDPTECRYEAYRYACWNEHADVLHVLLAHPRSGAAAALPEVQAFFAQRVNVD